MPIADNATIAWQQRVAKEDKVAAKFLLMQLALRNADGSKEAAAIDVSLSRNPWDNDWTSPLHSLHRVYTMPSTLPPLGAAQRNKSEALLPAFGILPRLGTIPPQHGMQVAPRTGEAEQQQFRASASRAHSRRSAQTRSAVTEVSLRKEIEQAVQHEVARLTENIEVEAQSVNRREKLEAILERQRNAGRVKLNNHIANFTPL